MKKYDIVIRGKAHEKGIEIPNVDVEDIKTLYTILKQYKIAVGIDKQALK